MSHCASCEAPPRLPRYTPTGSGVGWAGRVCYILFILICSVNSPLREIHARGKRRRRVGTRVEFAPDLRGLSARTAPHAWGAIDRCGGGARAYACAMACASFSSTRTQPRTPSRGHSAPRWLCLWISAIRNIYERASRTSRWLVETSRPPRGRQGMATASVGVVELETIYCWELRTRCRCRHRRRQGPLSSARRA